MDLENRPLKTTKPPIRRRARQARSKTTVQSILTAATELIAEQGVDVTMTEIAQRANVAMGSLYQYFADKSAIHRAILMQHNAAVRLMLHDYASRSTDAPSFVVAMESAFEQYFALHQQDPLFNGLWSIVQTDAELQRIDIDDSLQNGRYLQSVCAPWFPHVDADRTLAACALVMQLAMSTARFARGIPPTIGTQTRPVFRAMIRDAFAALQAEERQRVDRDG
ncbi:TetR/AcrR family transcriptional regulator [Solimonas marina]|uniref:TetR/AcrR family transcriptional regulator n=1 Tax=Solimonas marina TaxID=2714601 RepID=A0A970B7A3_9GAMM|nr:TetR/AcrR family transcriptional regulator [Solimonas marina]NKF23678.1 TetR/AcrR family transcriptional regulator [Solimonas marina]